MMSNFQLPLAFILNLSCQQPSALLKSVTCHLKKTWDPVWICIWNMNVLLPVLEFAIEEKYDIKTDKIKKSEKIPYLYLLYENIQMVSDEKTFKSREDPFYHISETLKVLN